jgi:hypothetical protein
VDLPERSCASRQCVFLGSVISVLLIEGGICVIVLFALREDR